MKNVRRDLRVHFLWRRLRNLTRKTTDRHASRRLVSMKGMKMKISNIVIALLLIGAPLPALTDDAIEFYYAECLQNAAIVNAMPNADGSPKDPNDHSSMLDPSNPELYRFCRYRATQKATGQ